MALNSLHTIPRGISNHNNINNTQSQDFFFFFFFCFHGSQRFLFRFSSPQPSSPWPPLLRSTENLHHRLHGLPKEGTFSIPTNWIQDSVWHPRKRQKIEQKLFCLAAEKARQNNHFFFNFPFCVDVCFNFSVWLPESASQVRVYFNFPFFSSELFSFAANNSLEKWANFPVFLVNCYVWQPRNGGKNE